MVSQPARNSSLINSAGTFTTAPCLRTAVGLCGAGAFLLLAASGCYRPHMMQGGYPYGSPMYSPQMQMAPGSTGAPGQLIIPEDSNAPLYEPGGSTYDDGFEKSNDDGSFYGSGGSSIQPVPEPRDPGSGASRPFEDDYNRGASLSSPSTQVNARPASAGNGETGVVRYDHAPNYSWLKGFLHYDEQQNVWILTYSLNQDEDEYGGDLTLIGDANVFQNLRSGTIVYATGGIYQQQRDSRGMPMYRAVEIRTIDLNPVR